MRTNLKAVFVDESETNTKQRLAQKNVGSGESIFNCGENSIEDGFIDAQLCGTLHIGDRGSGGDRPD